MYHFKNVGGNWRYQSGSENPKIEEWQTKYNDRQNTMTKRKGTKWQTIIKTLHRKLMFE
jgi:hypothetical protein